MSVNSKSFFQPLDRVAIALMLLLSLLIGLLLWQGDAVRPRVGNFSWEDRQVGAEDASFTLTFSRPMDRHSVEGNLRINPPLAGKVSWAGRRMVYTLLAPAPYDTAYTVKLQGAQDRFSEEKSNRQIEPFTGHFKSRDRAFIYLGLAGEEQGRLVLYNLTHQQKTLLTPKTLVAVDFKPYPTGEKILFSATDRTQTGLLSTQLYTVTTGVERGNSTKLAAGKIDLILDNKDYQNLKFELSPDGQSIVIQRVSQRNPSDFGLWVLHPNQPPQPMVASPGGDFRITPDSTAVAVAQGQGVAILPLQSQAQKPLDFLPQFGLVLDFANDGSAAAMVKFNSDYTRSLFWVNNQGVQKQLLQTTGSILSAQFNPNNQTLYCLLTQLLTGKTYQEQPYLAAIDLKTGKQTQLVKLPNQRDVRWSLSPDGVALLYDRVETATMPEPQSTQTNDGQTTVTSHLWLLPLLPDEVKQSQIQAEQLPLLGLHPRWLP